MITSLADRLKAYIEEELLRVREHREDCELLSLAHFYDSGEVNAYEKILTFLQDSEPQPAKPKDNEPYQVSYSMGYL